MKHLSTSIYHFLIKPTIKVHVYRHFLKHADIFVLYVVPPAYSICITLLFPVQTVYSFSAIWTISLLIMSDFSRFSFLEFEYIQQPGKTVKMS